MTGPNTKATDTGFYDTCRSTIYVNTKIKINFLLNFSDTAKNKKQYVCFKEHEVKDKIIWNQT